MHYSVILTSDGQKALDVARYEIYKHSTTVKNAAKKFHRLVKSINSLNFMPEREKLVEIEPARSLGVHRMIAGKYTLLFVISDKAVYVIRIIKSNRTINTFLSSMSSIKL